MVNEDENKYLEAIQQSLVDRTFTTAAYQTRIVREPKRRQIYILPYYPDRIVQHAIMNVIQPLWDKVFIYDTYSAIPGRGIHAAIARLDEFLSRIPGKAYCLQFDVRSYYPSMNHAILKGLVRRKIKCKGTLWLIDDIIDSVPGETNVPIGNYLSQYFGNIYLNWMDHWLKEIKRVKYYIRYNDDGVILHTDKGVLHHLREAIAWYLGAKLNMRLNPKTQVYPVESRGIDFLGYRTFRRYRLLRKRSARRFKKQMAHIAEHAEDMDPQTVASSIMSYVGWLQHADCYNLIRTHVIENDLVMDALDAACDELGFDNPIGRQYGRVNG